MKKKLGEILLEAGLIDPLQLQSALGHQRQWGGRLGEILVGHGFTTEEGVAECLARQLGLERVRLDGLDPEAARLLPEEVQLQQELVPYALERGERAATLYVATSDPTNLAALDQAQFRTGKRVRAAVATPSEIRRAIRHVWYGEPLLPPGPGAVEAGAATVPPEVSFDLARGEWDVDEGLRGLDDSAPVEDIELVPLEEELEPPARLAVGGAGPGVGPPAPTPPAPPAAPPPPRTRAQAIEADLAALGLGPRAPAPADDASREAVVAALRSLAAGRDEAARGLATGPLLLALVRVLLARGVIGPDELADALGDR